MAGRRPYITRNPYVQTPAMTLREELERDPASRELVAFLVGILVALVGFIAFLASRLPA